MMEQKRYRASVIRKNGEEEDWGFFAIVVNAYGTLGFRTNEATPKGDFDHFIAEGQWLEVRDIHEED